MTQHWWGDKKGYVINNGINLESVEVTIDKINRLKTRFKRIFVCSSNWHRQKRLKENIELFFSVKNLNDGLIILGNNPDHIVNHPQIIYAGHISHDMCMQVFSIADWMIHLAWLDHCPNVVVEALSQNCPVICTDSGGTKEIVGKNGIIIPESRSYNFELTDYDDPYELQILPIELPIIEIDNSHLDIKKVAQKYISILTEDI